MNPGIPTSLPPHAHPFISSGPGRKSKPKAESSREGVKISKELERLAEMETKHRWGNLESNNYRKPPFAPS